MTVAEYQAFILARLDAGLELAVGFGSVVLLLLAFMAVVSVGKR